MAKRQKPKGQTTIYKALHRKLKIDQHEPYSKLEVNLAKQSPFLQTMIRIMTIAKMLLTLY